MVDSLVNLTATKIAKYYRDGEYINKEIRVHSPVLSNLIFKKFWHAKALENKEVAKSLSDQLNITEIHLSRCSSNDVDFIGTLNNIQCVKIDCSWGLNYLSKNYQRGMVDLWEKLFNEQSRKTMSTLAIPYTDAKNNNWFQAIINMLPNLKNLNVSHCYLENSDLRTMPNSNLVMLDISFCYLTSLNGISGLSQLQALTLSGSQIESEHWQEVCSMESLRVLTRNVRALHAGGIGSLVQCVKTMTAKGQKPLRNLRMLDANWTDINATSLRVLCSSLPNLKVVSLVSTPLDLETNLETNSVKILNCATLTSSLDVFKFYSRGSLAMVYVYNAILKQIAQHHLAAIKRNDIAWKKEVFELLCKTMNCFMEKYECNIIRNCTVILETLCDYQFINLLSEEICKIVDLFKKFNDWFVNHNDDETEENEIVSNFWSIFARAEILKDFKRLNINTKFFFRVGLDLFVENPGTIICKNVLKVFLKFLKNVEYSTKIIGKSSEVDFYRKLHAHPPNDDREMYLLKMQVTLEIVRYSEDFCHLFIMDKIYEVYERELQNFSTRREIRMVQLKIIKIVIWNCEHFGFDPVLSIGVVNRFYNEILPETKNMRLEVYLKFCICAMIVVNEELDESYVQKIKGILKTMTLGEAMITEIDTDQDEQEMYDWIIEKYSESSGKRAANGGDREHEEIKKQKLE